VAELLARSSVQGRLTLTTVTIGSGVALLDGTVVNIALPHIGTDLGASLAELQWVVNGYMLSLAALILVGGSLGDRLGRRQMYLLGVAGFAIASALCAFAQSPTELIVFRVIQGIAAALLTPGGLAIIQSSFRVEDRASAIGTWAGVSGVAAAIGPFIGGFLLEHGGWRWIFAINLPLCAIVLFLGLKVPESSSPTDDDFDVAGAVAGAVALGSLTFALTSWRTAPLALIIAASVICLVAIVSFIVLERKPDAMMPVALFTSRVFTAANLMTFLVYGALGTVLFLLVLQLQVTVGYSAIAAGVATLPITIAMLLLSSRFAVIASRTGPRLPMTIGPLFCAGGVVLLAPVSSGTSYWLGVFPGIVLFALGLSGLVSPLTSAVLAAAPDEHAGVASGVNNAVARAGSLLAVAALPALVGLSGEDYKNPVVLTAGYHSGQLICAGLLAAGGIVSWIGLRNTGPVGQPSTTGGGV
jgi:EmrB/QacA subfamily drug resistance transporter